MKPALAFHRILIAKTSHLGDLIISLPMAATIKRHYPEATVIFLTHPRTVEVAKRCMDVDEAYGLPDNPEHLPELLKSLAIDVFIQANTSKELGMAAKAAAIPMRIGSWYRHYNWSLCTHTVAISRCYKQLNKRLLDLEYLKPLGIAANDLQAIPGLYRFTPNKGQEQALAAKLGLDFSKRRIILHPALITSKAHQWPLAAYSELIASFDRNRFQWLITGMAAEREYLQPLLNTPALTADVLDTVGQLTLDELTTLMMECDGLVAGSTGPLHLAAAVGLHTLGLFQSRPSINKRWSPMGRSATTLYSSVPCQGDKSLTPCPCILAIRPEQVREQILTWFENDKDGR
ncbi:MAG: glycosyltransferase family 9 protein [Methylovulum sp.]|nr:glycosyltransferase family 9 protein [Methylovulum sp.]